MLRVVLFALFAILLSPLFASAQWPVARGDALMTGTSNAKLPDKLEIKWEFKIPIEEKKAKTLTVEGAPAIADGVVYVGSLNKRLYAIDLATGKEKWKTKFDDELKASPCVRNKHVYIGDRGGFFHCLNAADGKEIWKFETGGEIAAGCNFHGNNVLIGSHDSTLYCLDEKGKQVWAFKTDGPVNGSPAVIGDVTFVAGCDSILHTLNAKTGAELGTVELNGQAAATAAVVGDFAYVGTMANTVVAVDLKKKERIWSFEAPVQQQPFYASAASAELVIAGSRDKKVYGLDPKTGTKKWSFLTKGQVDSSPVVAGGKVYVGSLTDEDNNFYVLDLKTGKPVQELQLSSAVTGSIAVGPDCLVVGTEDGTVYCLGKK